MTEDDVTDYMVMEAVAVKVSHEDNERAKEAERHQWRRAKSPSLEAMK